MTPTQRDDVFAFDPGDFEHPILSAFQGNPDAGLERTQVYAYIQATTPGRNCLACGPRV